MIRKHNLTHGTDPNENEELQIWLGFHSAEAKSMYSRDRSECANVIGVIREPFAASIAISQELSSDPKPHILSQEYCRTNGRRNVVQIGGVLQ